MHVDQGFTARSAFLLGRSDTQEKFHETGRVTVSAYRTIASGKLRYTIANPKTPAGPRVLYRVHLKRVK